MGLIDAADHKMSGCKVVDWAVEHQFVVQNDQGKHVVQSYLASITFAGAPVGRLLDAIEAEGLRDYTITIVVLWSDHGIHIGEKDNWEKFTVWERFTRVPFFTCSPLWNIPRLRAGRLDALQGEQHTLSRHTVESGGLHRGIAENARVPAAPVAIRAGPSWTVSPGATHASKVKALLSRMAAVRRPAGSLLAIKTEPRTSIPPSTQAVAAAS